MCGVWACRYRDPDLPTQRTELTRFPHAVLEVKLSLPEGQTAPPWVTVRRGCGENEGQRLKLRVCIGPTPVLAEPVA